MREVVSGLDIQQCFQTTGVVTDDGAVLVLNGGAAVYLKKKMGYRDKWQEVNNQFPKKINIVFPKKSFQKKK